MVTVQGRGNTLGNSFSVSDFVNFTTSALFVVSDFVAEFVGFQPLKTKEQLEKITYDFQVFGRLTSNMFASAPFQALPGDDFGVPGRP